MLRALPRLRRDLLGYLADLTARYGDVVVLPAPRRPMLLLNDPDAVRRVLQDNHRGYDKGTLQYAALAGVTGGGLLAADGPAWRHNRRLLQPGFHTAKVAALVYDAAAAGAALGRRWTTRPHGIGAGGIGAGGIEVDVETDIGAASFSVLAALLGDDAARHGPAAVRAVDAATRALIRLAPLPARLPVPQRATLRRAVAELDRICAELVAADSGDGMVALLRDAHEHGALSARGVRDELVTLLIAGQETVAASLTWTLHLLAANPVAQRRLHTELDDVLAGRRPQQADLASLRWTRAVLEESLRLYPPAWVLTRRALEPDVLAGTEVEAGTVLVISPWLLHRRESAWPEPERFRPERFLAPAARECGYLPFGAGPRLCIGREVALVEGTALLAGLLAGVRLRPRPGAAAPRPQAGVSVRPRGGLRLLADTR